MYKEKIDGKLFTAFEGCEFTKIEVSRLADGFVYSKGSVKPCSICDLKPQPGKVCEHISQCIVAAQGFSGNWKRKC